MLVLSRKKSEKILFDFDGEIVEVLIVEILGDKVRLGIVAPSEVTVHREEVWLEIHDPCRCSIPNMTGNDDRRCSKCSKVVPGVWRRKANG